MRLMAGGAMAGWLAGRSRLSALKKAATSAADVLAFDLEVRCLSVGLEGWQVAGGDNVL